MKTKHHQQKRKAQQARRAARKTRTALKTEVAPQEQAQSCIYMQGGTANIRRIRSFARRHQAITLDQVSSRIWLT